MFEIDRAANRPLTDQIVGAVSQRVEDGRLLKDSRMPSVRQLASRLGVSPHTVLAAFDRLIGLGYLVARPGAGYYVVRPPRAHGQDDTALTLMAQQESWAPNTSDGFARHALAGDAGLLPAGSGYLPPHWYEDALTPAILARALKSLGSRGHAMPPVEGLPALREQLAERLRRRRIAATAAHVVSTFGATHALELAARALVAPGEAVLVDDPGYFLLHSQLAALGLRVASVPRDEDGPDLDALDRLATELRPRAFFTQTLLHNPTGASMSPTRCHRLLNLAEAHGFALVEDDVYGDLADDQALRLAQIDGLRRVVYVGSFSKVYTPSIRVGYIAAQPDLVQRMASLKLSEVLGGSALDEAIIAEALHGGMFHRQAARQRQRLARARAASIAALADIDVESVGRDTEGIFLWCRLPGGLDAEAVSLKAKTEGVLLAAGTMFTRSGGCRDMLRINAVYGTDPALLRVLQGLAR